MFYKIFMFLTGIVFTVVGFTFIIIYSNLMSMGLGFVEYLKYICTKFECLIGIVGIVLILISLYRKEDRYGIYL